MYIYINIWASDCYNIIYKHVMSHCREDKKPGLIGRNKGKQYQKEERIKKTNIRNQTKPRKVIEREKRDEGLQKSIGSDNKGFALLSKMGYKPGMGIGKSGNVQTQIFQNYL